jgi:hypothetical protein
VRRGAAVVLSGFTTCICNSLNMDVIITLKAFAFRDVCLILCLFSFLCVTFDKSYYCFICRFECAGPVKKMSSVRRFIYFFLFVFP